MAGVVPGVDLSPIIDRQKIGAFHVKLIAIAFLVVMADGYDIGAAAFAAPALIREWHVAPEALGGMFSAGLFAGFFGPLILGWISDHYGRRTAIISGAAFFGLFTLASVLAQNLGTLIVLRFIAGVGISGVLPITTALVNEYSPRRVRATLFVLMFSGVTFGGGLPGIVAAKFMGAYGWQVLFWVGGIAPIVVAILVYFTLPESIKFLSLRREGHLELVRILAVMQPGLTLDPNSSFTIGGEENREKFSYTAIFNGRPRLDYANVLALECDQFDDFLFCKPMDSNDPLDQRRTGRACGACDHRVPVRRHARRPRHYAAARQIWIHSGADTFRHRHSCRGLHRPAWVVGGRHDRPGRSGGFLSPRAAIRQYRLRDEHVSNLHPVMGRGLVLRRRPCRLSDWPARRWDPHRHEAADTISILYSGNSSGDRAHKRDLVDAAIPRRNDPVRFLNQIDWAKEPREHHGSGAGFWNATANDNVVDRKLEVRGATAAFVGSTRPSLATHRQVER
jgi:hypothetical protein